MAVKNKFLKQMAEKADQAEKTREQYGMSIEEIQKYGAMKIVKIDDILEDPDNKKIYGADYDTDGFAEVIKNHGFKGAILVYPYNGKYMVQSGHRSLEASRKAGLREVPVIQTTPPASDAERLRMLVTLNLSNRVKTPLMIAREIQTMYDTYKEEREKNSDGKRQTGMIRDIVAKDFNISSAQVERYRKLLRLNSELQAMVEKEKAPWSALAEAAVLDQFQQEQLVKFLRDKLKLKPDDSLSKAEVMREIEICRMMKPGSGYTYDRNDVSMLSDELKAKLVPEEKQNKRRVNQKTAVEKSASYLSSMLEPSAFVYKKDKKEVIKTLEKMKNDIEAALLMLNS